MDIHKVGVVGLGLMGSGIAQICAQAGLETIGREISPELCERGRGAIEGVLGGAVERQKLSAEDRDATLARLTMTTELSDLADCDVVIEAIVENIDAKHALFADLDRIVKPEAILATNTSALSITDVASAATRAERVVGLHFFSPAPVQPLVEVVRAELTADDVYERAFMFAERIGKRPIRCFDTPGFVVNRMLIPILNDAIRVLDEARVSPEDLDLAMRLGTAWPMGPCALLDLIGIDVAVHAAEAMYQGLREPRIAPPPRLVNMLKAGHLGRKTGQGFYNYDVRPS